MLAPGFPRRRPALGTYQCNASANTGGLLAALLTGGRGSHSPGSRAPRRWPHERGGAGRGKKRRPRPPPVAARGPAAAEPGGPRRRARPLLPGDPQRAADTRRGGGAGAARGQTRPGGRSRARSPSRRTGVSGGSAPPPPGCQPRSPATAATSRSAAAQSPSTRSRGIAMLRFSSIAPASPSSRSAPGAAGGSHRPCGRRRQRPGQRRVAARHRARPRGYGDAQTSGSGRGEPRENLLRGDGAGRLGSGRVRSGPLAAAGRSPPAGLAAATPLCGSVRPSVRPCPAAASFRKWRSRAVTARCAPPLTSRHEYA